MVTDQEMPPFAPAPKGSSLATSHGKKPTPLKFRVNKLKSILKNIIGSSALGSHTDPYASTSKQIPTSSRSYVTHHLDRS
ncbi:hypothetical protein V6N13_071643 [Hibiscus sabdariffa]